MITVVFDHSVKECGDTATFPNCFLLLLLTHAPAAPLNPPQSGVTTTATTTASARSGIAMLRTVT